MRTVLLLPLVCLLAGCGSPGGGGLGSHDAAPPSTGAAPANAAPRSAAGTGQPVAGQRTFVIVPQQSNASYLADEEFFAGALKKLGITAGKRKVVGSTQAIEGQFQLDPERPTTRLGQNSFTVQMNTLTTGESRRDTYIREEGPGFNHYPRATFTATGIEGAGLSFKLTGNMTIREITKPATFDVQAQLASDTLTGVATTRLKMSDFGIEPLAFYNTLTVADAFGIEVRFTARAQTK